jgi:hypothetical protein
MSEQETTVDFVQLRKSFKYGAVSLILCYIGMCPSPLAVEPYKEIGNPGGPINLQPHVVCGQVNSFRFRKPICPPCRAATVQFKALAHQYPNHYAFRRIDINRPGVVGIDWASPLARQYGLQSIQVPDRRGRHGRKVDGR